MLGLKLNHVSKRGHREQAITLTNGDFIHWRIEASPGLNVLIYVYVILSILLHCEISPLQVTWSILLLLLTFAPGNHFITISRPYKSSQATSIGINILRPERNGRYFADDIYKCIFVKDNAYNTVRWSLWTESSLIYTMLRIEIIIQLWFRYWLGTSQVTSH